MATSLAAGLDLRKVLLRESQSGRPYHRRQLAAVHRSVAQGDSLAEALGKSDDYFPPLMIEMAQVGEATGRLDRVLSRIGDYYEHLIQLRREFLIRIAWPVLQLAIAVAVIGLLILALGWVSSMTGQTSDILGYGLVGVPGLIKYLVGLGLVAAVAIVGFRLITSRRVLPLIVPRLMLLPGLGRTLRSIALSRLCWTLGLANGAGADAWDAVRLALHSTSNDYYRGHAADVERKLRQGQDLYSTLSETGCFPAELLDTVHVAEESGTVSESMLRLANSYQQDAKQSMAGVTMVASVIVWGLVAGILIFLIFRVFGFYVKTLDPANYGI